MSVSSTFLRAPFERWLGRFGRRPWAALVELAARLGYLARGIVHVSVGVIALLAAADLAPRAAGMEGSMEAWSRWPAGVALLWLIGSGLYAFAGWRALQALFDADRQGRSAKALATRAGQAVSGAIYAGLAISVFSILDALEDLGELEDRAQTRAAVAEALQAPFGPWLVAGAGLFVLGAGLGSMGRAVLDHFGRDLPGASRFRRAAGTLARIGYFGRGLALLPSGLFLAASGLQSRPGQARNLGGALDALERQPFGGTVLTVAALGLIAFGLFAMVEGWLRPIRPEQAVD